MELAAQIVSIFGMVASVLSLQAKTYKGIMLWQTATSSLLAISFLLLYLSGTKSALTATFVLLSLIVRNIAFMIVRKKGMTIFPATIASLIIIILLGVFSWTGYTSLLYIIGMGLSTLSFAMEKPQKVRILMMFCLPVLFAYDVITKSIGATASDVLPFASTIIAYIRYRKPRVE